MYPYNKLNSHYKKLYSYYLIKLTKILNNYHKKQYNSDYWEAIIGLYLRKIIINYLFSKKIKKKIPFKKIDYQNVNFYKNYTEFSNDKEILFYNLKNTKNSKYFKIDKINFFFRIINTIRTISPNILIKIGITKIFFQESYFKKSLRNFLFLRSFFYLNFLPKLNCENFNIDKKNILHNRMDLINEYEKNNQKDYFLRNILISMPINYIENYNVILNEVKKINISDAIYIDGNEVKFDFIKFYIAELILKKKKIFSGQHSLRTGLEDYDIYFDYSKSISHYYLTWGWKNKDNTIMRFSSTRIFSSLNKYKKNNLFQKNKSSVCFVLCGFSKIGDCLHDNYFENYKAEQARIDFLEQVKKLKEINITLKPREGSFLLEKKKNFYNKFNVLGNKARIYEVFGNYDIVLYEKISLGIAECIYLNQPVIFYYPKNLYKQKNKQINELLFLLKKANIYFDDKKKIMKLLNSKNHISLWWMNKKNEKYRKKFLSKFARLFKYSDLNELKKLI